MIRRMSNTDILRHETSIINDKIDKLFNDLPMLYEGKQDYQMQQEKLERRIDTLEARVQTNADKVDELHRSSKEWANDTFADLMKQFTEESKAIRKEMSDLRTSLYMLIIVSILLPILFMIISHFLWH